MAKARSRGSVAILLSIALPGFVCAKQGQQISAPIAGARQTAEFTAPASDRPRLAERNPRYKINRSDILNLSFPLSPEFNQTVTVQPDGYITLQGAGSICILGMTVPETSEAIKKAYARVLHEPIVDVDLKDFQKAYFIVTGQVTKPGQYDLRYDLTASQAIAIAGGLMLGGAKPLVVIQCTGLFEAGDALRNIVHDLKLPLVFIIGLRSYHAYREGRSADTCPKFTVPILNAWCLPHVLLERGHTATQLEQHLRHFLDRREAGTSK